MREAGLGVVCALALGGLVPLAGCRQEQGAADARQPHCETITDVIGSYRCSGDCVLTSEGKREVNHVTGEKSVVERYPGTEAELYQVKISNEGFSELEIGALIGNTLRAATAEVTKDQFPVLEDYVFESDVSCKARAFTKSVRNPHPGRLQELFDSLRKGVSALRMGKGRSASRLRARYAEVARRTEGEIEMAPHTAQRRERAESPWAFGPVQSRQSCTSAGVSGKQALNAC